MPQFREAMSALFRDEEPEQDLDKDGIKIRIALFYDGTLNNRNNIKVREASGDAYDQTGGRHLPEDTEVRYDKKGKKLPTKKEIYEKYRDPEGPNSYDNGRTNINIMEAQVENKAQGYDHYLKLYVEGQGTFNDRGDSLSGYSMGGLSSGVPRRATKGIVDAITKIQKAIAEQPPESFYIEKLTIDVFGFSRGAATARQSIHQMIKSTLSPMYVRLRAIGYRDTRKSSVKVCFAGLYDTVLSYWAGQYLHTQWLLDMKAVEEAEHVLHLAASDEHRIDFPVSNINSAKAVNGEEYFLPGVHSDVGGSYNLALDLESQKDIADEEKEYMRTTSEEYRMINEGHPDMLAVDRQNLIDLGWYKPKDIKVENITLGSPAVSGPHGRSAVPPRGELRASRQGIRSAYSNIPLKIMASYAAKNGVCIHPDLKNIADRILRDEADLKVLEEKILAYVTPVRGKSTDPSRKSKPEDWLTDPTISAIRYRHFNFSSKVKTGYNPRIRDGIRTRYIVNA